MQNVYLSQPNYLHGPENKNMYLPYAVACLWAYSSKDKYISDNYILKEIFVLRDNIGKVVDRIENPYIVGFSCYIWNEKYQLELSKQIKKRFPSCLIVFGGPQVPDDPKKYLKENPQIDICIRGEGEEPFKQILLGTELTSIKGVHTKFSQAGHSDRIENLDDIPSPYTNGLFDNLIEKHTNIDWHIMLESNRGCPFKCTFCDWGALTFSKIKKYSMDRIKKDMDWAAGYGSEYLLFADANFGIFKDRDEEIVDYIVELKEKNGYPEMFAAAWTKNSNESVLNLAEKLYNSNLLRSLTFSVQSMSEAVLDAIKRNNMKVNDLDYLLQECNKKQIPYYTELILGLPEETYDSWVDGICKLLTAGQHSQLEMHFLQILRNSLLNNEGRNMKTAKTETYFDGSENIDEYQETVEIVVGTETMDFNDFIECIVFNWLVVNFHSYGWTQLVSRYLVKRGDVSYKSFYKNLLDYVSKSNFLKKEMNLIKNEARHYFTKGYFKNLNIPAQRLIYSSQFNMHKNSDKVWKELDEFFNQYQLDGDLLRLQKSYIRDLKSKYPYKLKFDFNWFEYIINDTELINKPFIMEFDVMDEVRTKLDYRENLYYKKRQGWGNTIIR